jgi:hypothetical protein
MIVSVPSMWPRADRIRQSSSDLFGNDPQTYRSDFTERKAGVPQWLLVEQPVPGSTVLPHYHATDQFQIFLEGDGRLGRHAIKPLSIHYTNRYTGYGPIVAGPSGVSYYVLRPEFDQLVTGQYLHVPALREKLRQEHGHKRAVMVDEVAIKALDDLSTLTAPVVERVIDAEAAEAAEERGTFADVLSLGPNMHYAAADPASGGGQVFLVLQGAMQCNGESYAVRSGVGLTCDEKALTLTAGDRGLQALVLQYPRRDLN